MDTIIAILKENKVINSIVFAHDPSADEIQQFVELLEGDEGRKLTEYEIVNATGEIEEPVQPYPSWIWDSLNRVWKAPVEQTDPSLPLWNETEGAWQALE
jgi:hypothetical protein